MDGLISPQQVYDNLKLNEYIKNLKNHCEINKKVLLIQAPQFLFDSFNIDVAKNRGYYAFPPTGLQTIAKSLSNLDLEVNLLDLNYELLNRVINNDLDISQWLTILDEYLAKFNPSIVGITCLTEYNDVLNSNHPLTAILKNVKRKFNKIVIIGGPTPTNEYAGYLTEDLCDFVVTKEGEGKIKFLFDSLYGHEKTMPTPGIFFKFNNKLEETFGREVLFPLKGNLIDTYKNIPVENYHRVGCLNPFSRMAGRDKIFATFQLNRGCRANCRFCDVTKFMGRGVRTFPVEDVVEEINFLVEQRGVRHFDVLDDDFLGNPTAVKDLLKRIIPLKEKYGITWSASNGLILASCTEEILQLALDSGCIGFRIGIESGNAEMLRRIRKPASLPVILQKSLLLQKFPQIFVGANFIIGLFGEETFGKMIDTLMLAAKINVDWSSYSTFQFTSRETAIVENLNFQRGVAMNFTPAKDNSKGEIYIGKGIISGKEVFNIPLDEVPSPEQVKQIWFTFNLVGNYINNKNLKLGGDHFKFISWVEALLITYPQNPYMHLFIWLGYVLLGNNQKALPFLHRTIEIIEKSKYWKDRFIEFDLFNLVINFPINAKEVHNSLDKLRADYSKWINF